MLYLIWNSSYFVSFSKTHYLISEEKISIDAAGKKESKCHFELHMYANQNVVI